MDPALDPPPVSAHPAGAVPPVAPFADASPVAAAANPSPAQPVAHNHPPYAEMISAAISALNERDGSSKRAIAKYIETQYSDLPPTHSALLAHHLKRLKTSGQLVMVKHSYKLPSRSTAAAVNGAINNVSADPTSTGTKRRPGRPPKSKPDAVQAAVPVFGAPPAVIPVAPPPENAAIGPVNGAAAVHPVRGRGRPPKRGPGRPLKSGGVPSGGSVGRGRGRPKKNYAAPASAITAARGKGPGRPRGRPPKPINIVEGLAPVAPLGGGLPEVPVSVGVAPPVVGKRRGRPPKAGGVAKKPRNMSMLQPRKPRKLSGKPLGRPRKDALGNQTPESQLLDAYLGLQEKISILKDKVRDTAALVKPSLTSEAAINAIQELEVMAANINAPPEAQVQHEPLPPPPQPVRPQSPQI